MAPRSITLHAFCSAKGGVGKSTLAVASAKLLAETGRRCVLIDADLTGTSLADGLRVCAPKVTMLTNGDLDFGAAPSGQYWTREETYALRSARKEVKWDDDAPSPPPPFLNDIMRYVNGNAGECRMDALLWRQERDDGVWYLPSSPLRRDILIALGWLYREEPFAWLQRMTWLLDGMGEQLPALSDVIIDLPPGLFGFAHETLALLSNLELGAELPSGFPPWNQRSDLRWRGNPLLITTPDQNDLLAAMDYFIGTRAELPHLGLVLNKASTSTMNHVRDSVALAFGEQFSAAALEPVDKMRLTLGQIFTAGELRMTDELRKLHKALRLERRS